jgi:hypothetical protein
MPPRPKQNRRRPQAGAEAWPEVFSSEFDFFDDLRDAGIALDDHGRPDREEARAAWHRFGAEFLAGFSGEHVPWAVAEFGDPHASKT